MKPSSWLLAFCISFFTILWPGISSAQFIISVGIEPPPLPVYVQPPIPADGYIWTPGYWYYEEDDYFWVPGAWVEPPSAGLLWTPGYWSYESGSYGWRGGYWGESVGYYGGIAYGFGYTGDGFAGGYWSGPRFFYNRSVTNITNTTIIQNNTYVKNVIVNKTVTNVSVNGGPNGTAAKPTPDQLAAAAKGKIVPPTAQQARQLLLAKATPALKKSNNGGVPKIAAVSTAGDFTKGVIAAKAAGRMTAASNRKSGITASGSGNKAKDETVSTPVKGAQKNPSRVVGIGKQMPKTNPGPEARKAKTGAPNLPKQPQPLSRPQTSSRPLQTPKGSAAFRQGRPPATLQRQGPPRGQSQGPKQPKPKPQQNKETKKPN